MIGDSPGLSIAARNGQLYTKVLLLEAGTITLPIGPNHSIGLGKRKDHEHDNQHDDCAIGSEQTENRRTIETG